MCQYLFWTCYTKATFLCHCTLNICFNAFCIIWNHVLYPVRCIKCYSFVIWKIKTFLCICAALKIRRKSWNFSIHNFIIALRHWQQHCHTFTMFKNTEALTFTYLHLLKDKNITVPTDKNQGLHVQPFLFFVGVNPAHLHDERWGSPKVPNSKTNNHKVLFLRYCAKPVSKC